MAGVGEPCGTPDSAAWMLRANACELLAFSLRYPDEEIAEAILSGEWTGAAQEICSVLQADRNDGVVWDDVGYGIDGLRHMSVTELIEALRIEATRLFIGVPDPIASPYEGVWHGADEGEGAELFCNRHSIEVTRFASACGLGRAEGKNEPMDHIATEFELLEYLAVLAADITQIPEGGPAPEAFPGGSPQNAYRLFLGDHVRVWAPGFFEKIRRESRSDFYRTLGAYGAALIDVA